MTNEQLAEAIRELQGIVVVQRRDLEVLRTRIEELEDSYGRTLDEHGNRLWQLERQAQASEDSQRELSAHLNGMTYP
jgi:hypothetical protein